MTLTVDNVTYRGTRDFLYNAPYDEEGIDARSVKRIGYGIYETHPLNPDTASPFSVYWPQVLVTQYLHWDRGWSQYKIDRWLEETA